MKNDKDLIFSLFGDQILKRHLGLLTEFNSHCNSQHCVCVFMITNFNLQLGHETALALIPFFFKMFLSWFYPSCFIDMPCWVTLPSCRFEFGGHKSNLPVLAAVLGISQVNRFRSFLKLDPRALKWPISGICQWISMKAIFWQP